MNALRIGLVFGTLLLVGCTGDDNSGQVVGPPVNIHCQNAVPQGSADPTVRVTCPPPALVPQGVDP